MGDQPRQNAPGKIKYFLGISPSEITDAVNALIEDINTVGLVSTDFNHGTNATSSTFWRGDTTWNQVDFSNLTGNIAVAQMNGGAAATSSTFWRGDATWGAVNFSNLAGNIAASQMNNGTSASSSTFWRGDATWVQPGFSSLSGNIATSQMNSGTGAAALTFWRGDGSWATPPGIYHDGRLTLTAGIPVLTSTVTGATVVYYAPYNGQNISVYDGTGVNPYNFLSSVSDTTGLTLTLGSNWGAATLFDVFVTIQAGVPVLATVAWTNATTRATNLARYGGILTNATSATARTSNTVTITMAQNQGTYVGTFATTGAGAVDFIFGAAASGGTASVLNLWNAYNRVLTSTLVIDNGATYTYSTATTRAARASNTNRVTWVSGLAHDGVVATYTQRVDTAAAAAAFSNVGIALDATNSFNVIVGLVYSPSAAVIAGISPVSSAVPPQLGQHFLQAVEKGDGTNTNTFNTGATATLTAMIWN